MSVRRVMGTETEYAVLADAAGRHGPGSVRRDDPVSLSFAVVREAADPATARIHWDYGGEDPTRDTRGGRLERTLAPRSMLTDDSPLDVVNVLAPNGGRIYVDHAHPEYSSPECVEPFQALAYARAGDVLMLDAARRASRRQGRRIELFRNNVDGKGATWGCHENYQCLRSVPFHVIAALMTAHLVTRQIYCGSGRVGLGPSGRRPGFQLSQRADYIQSPIGLQTTFERPIVNTRDEPHSTADFRRLHVIVGDANRMDVPRALALGTTSMLLWLVELAQGRGASRSAAAGRVRAYRQVNAVLRECTLADPVAAMHQVSHDLTLTRALALRNRRTAGALDIQVTLVEAVEQAGRWMYGPDHGGGVAWPDRPTAMTIALWHQALDDVRAIAAADDDRRLTLAAPASRVEWLLKWQLLERLRRRRHGAGEAATTGWDEPTLAAADLRWGSLDPHDSLYARLAGRSRQLVGESQAALAQREPPEQTRAWLRTMLIRRYPRRVLGASWTRLRVLGHGFTYLDISDPLACDAGHCRGPFETASSFDDLIARLNVPTQ